MDTYRLVRLTAFHRLFVFPAPERHSLHVLFIATTTTTVPSTHVCPRPAHDHGNGAFQDEIGCLIDGDLGMKVSVDSEHCLCLVGSPIILDACGATSNAIGTRFNTVSTQCLPVGHDGGQHVGWQSTVLWVAKTMWGRVLWLLELVL